MGLHNLHRLFEPRSIAVVGASETQGTIGNALMENLLASGFPGTLHPVNPKHAMVHGLACSPSVAALKPQIDLAIIATPIQTVAGIVRRCVAQRMGGAIIISAGGRETGSGGRETEQHILSAAQSEGFRLIGPNCLGIMCPQGQLNPTFVSGMPPAGDLAIISQSGAICTTILDMAATDQIGISHFVSIGSMLDVDFGDMIEYLGHDNSVKTILLYIESLSHFRKFMHAARSVSQLKPIIALKAGTSLAGARAAASHTGALAGEDAVYDAAFRRAGIVRVHTLEELFDSAALLRMQPRTAGTRVGVITNAGGPGVMAADYLSHQTLAPPPLSPTILARLNAILPPYWSRNNPIDILGDTPLDIFGRVIELCLHSQEFDALLFILAPQALTEPLHMAQTLAETVKDSPLPMVACWLGSRAIAPAAALLNHAGIPTYATPERAINALSHGITYASNLPLVDQRGSQLTSSPESAKERVTTLLHTVPHQAAVPEDVAEKILTNYGLPVVATEPADSEARALQLARSLGYPVTLKVDSPEISHKTEVGGVRLDLRSDDEVADAYQQITGSAPQHMDNCHIRGVRLQPHISGADYELLLGAVRDPDFGPVILFGIGGILTELIHDRALDLVPMNRLLARRLIQATKAYTLLRGYRNKPPVKMHQLEAMILHLSHLLIDFPQIEELDLNPILVKNGACHIVDVRLLISPCTAPTPHHLALRL